MTEILHGVMYQNCKKVVVPYISAMYWAMQESHHEQEDKPTMAGEFGEIRPFEICLL